MSWKKIRGHDEIVELFRQAAGKSRLGSSFLFTGPSGIGKHAFALTLAESLLCETNGDAALDLPAAGASRVCRSRPERTPT